MSEYKSIEKINDELSKACNGGDYEIVKSSILKGANIHHKDIYGNTPLILASTYGHIKVVELLILNGANIHDKNNKGYSPIIVSPDGNIEVTELLISFGANVNDKTIHGNSPLYYASMNIDIIKLLISNGACIYHENNDGFSILIQAEINFSRYKNNEGYPLPIRYDKCFEIVQVLKRWPLTMLIVVLQELVVYHLLDCESFSDFNEYFGEIV